MYPLLQGRPSRSTPTSPSGQMPRLDVPTTSAKSFGPSTRRSHPRLALPASPYPAGVRPSHSSQSLSVLSIVSPGYSATHLSRRITISALVRAHLTVAWSFHRLWANRRLRSTRRFPSRHLPSRYTCSTPAFSTEPFTTLPRPDYAHLPISNPQLMQHRLILQKRRLFIHSSVATPDRSISPSIAPRPTPEQKLMSTHLDIVSRTYCKSIQAAIIKSSAGLRRLMAQVGAESSRAESLDPRRQLAESVLRGAGKSYLHHAPCPRQRLAAPQIPPRSTSVRSSHRPAQHSHRAELPNEQLTAEFFHRTCFALFAQEKQHGGLDNWVLPVNRYVVARCMGRETWIKANENHSHLCQAAHLISSDQAYQEVKKFLLANNDTPSAFIYDVHHTVRKIRDEYNDADVQMENESHTRLIFDGHRIDLSQFKTLAEALTRRHADILGEHIFFGRGVDQSYPIQRLRQQRWKLHPTRQLLERFEELRLILAIRCIVSCGPSVRAAEFARQSLRNLPGGAARNVVLLYRTLSRVPSVSKDLIWNLAVFRPFEQFLISQFKGPIDAERYFTSMWPGIDADFTSHLISTTLIIEYRKIVGTFCRYIVDPFLYKTLEDSLFDELQNHSTGMSYMRYGVEKQTLASSDPRKVVGCIKACRAWGAATGIDGGIPIKLELPPNLENQTVLLPHTAGTGSGDPPSALSLDTIQRAISETLRSDEFIKRESLEAPLTQIIASLAALYFPKVPEPPSANRLQPISSVVVHPSRRNALREFRGDETASWTCPHQAELLERMRDKKRHILAVLACNSGKTATILMQANIFDSASTTIFVLPVSGLHQDLHRRATQSRLNVARWKPDHAAFNADFNVLYVSVEDIRDEFIRFAKGLALTQRLANLVVDEAHIALTDANYREPIRRLIRLATEIEAHITLLSGSIGPQHETPLLDMFLLQNVDVIRMPSWRSNIEYLVSLHAAKTDQTGCKVETYVEAAVVYIKWRMKQTAGNCYRMIVYCRSVRVAEDAAKALGVVAYHAGVDMDARRRIFNNWLAGVDQVIVSTSILGAGIDTIVREVIQLDVAHTVIDSHQQANRAGRDNLPARVIVFASCKREPSLGEDHKASLGSVYLVPWLFHFVCRRLLFALFLDGVGVTCGVIPGAQYCDVCHLQSRQPAPRNAPPMPTASSQEELAALLPLLVTAQARREAILRAPDVKRLLYSGARHTVASSNTSARQANSLLEQDHPPRLRKIPRIEPRPVRHQPVSHPMTNDSPAFLPPPPLPPSMSPPWYLPPPSPHFGRHSIHRIRSFHHLPSSTIHPRYSLRPCPTTIPDRRRHTWLSTQSSARSLDSSPASSLLPSHVKHEPAQFRGYENPPPPSSQPAGTRVDQPASVPGISVVIAQNEHVLRKKECIQICREVTAALDTILSKQGCAVCLIRQRIDWDAHSLDDCSANVATANDLRYQGWKGTAMKLPDGWCFHCMRPQGKIGSFQTHEWMEAAASRCAHAGVIKAMLYAFFTSAQGTLVSHHAHLSLSNSVQSAHVYAQFPFFPALSLHLWLIGHFNIKTHRSTMSSASDSPSAHDHGETPHSPSAQDDGETPHIATSSPPPVSHRPPRRPPPSPVRLRELSPLPTFYATGTYSSPPPRASSSPPAYAGPCPSSYVPTPSDNADRYTSQQHVPTARVPLPSSSSHDSPYPSHYGYPYSSPYAYGFPWVYSPSPHSRPPADHEQGPNHLAFRGPARSSTSSSVPLPHQRPAHLRNVRDRTNAPPRAPLDNVDPFISHANQHQTSAVPSDIFDGLPLPAAGAARKDELVAICDRVNAALRYFSAGRCVICFLRGTDDWDQHVLDRCAGPICSFGDYNYRDWKNNGFELPPGWCFYCLRPQHAQGGYRMHEKTNAVASCMYKGLIKAALYAFFSAEDDMPLVRDCTIIPTHLRGMERLRLFTSPSISTHTMPPPAPLPSYTVDPGRRIVYIDSVQQCDEMLQSLDGPFGFDTEFTMSADVNRIEVVQLATRDATFVIHLQPMAYIISNELYRILTDTRVLLAGIGLANDLGVFYRGHGIDLTHLVELGVLTMLYDPESLPTKYRTRALQPMGMCSAAEYIFGKTIDKGPSAPTEILACSRRSNYSVHAATDGQFCYDLFTELATRMLIKSVDNPRYYIPRTWFTFDAQEGVAVLTVRAPDGQALYTLDAGRRLSLINTVSQCDAMLKSLDGPFGFDTEFTMAADVPRIEVIQLATRDSTFVIHLKAMGYAFPLVQAAQGH
ncbi:unnamed protein product [Mycena citricolor]|uniref:DNA 3'-5' helicase n=1 Tax=Mycena citricolor TaxID=2018698 RepID=A0AAD2HZJ7_9AGAR|nr:unnamed protein product [Mycena citricolor]